MKSQPFVSILIPVFNDAADLRLTLAALKNQTYPEDQFAVIVVDNGSTDDSIKIAKSFENVTVICEHQHKKSPYSARNRGLVVATGDVIALLDATCIPHEKWLVEAVSAMACQKADLLGGAVTFRYGSDSPTTAEWLDSIINIQMEDSILQRNVAKTANLFVRRSVFDAIGMFPEGLRSGGDVRWTRCATSAGFKLVYCNKAIVYKKARSLMALIKKQWRVGKGQLGIWQEEGNPASFSKLLLSLFSFPKPSYLRLLIKQRGRLEMTDRFYRLWMTFCAVRVVLHVSHVYALWCMKRKERPIFSEE